MSKTLLELRELNTALKNCYSVKEVKEYRGVVKELKGDFTRSIMIGFEKLVIIRLAELGAF